VDESANKSKDVEELLDGPTLVGHCLAGQERAWQAVADRLHRLASAWLALHQAGSPADVDDLVQEVLTILLANDRHRRLPKSVFAISQVWVVVAVSSESK